MEQYQRIMSESVTPETVAALPPPPTPVWPEDEEVQNDAGTDDEAPPSLGNIMASVEAIYHKYISVKPGGKLTKEGIRQVFEALDMEYAERAKRRRLKAPNGLPSNDFSEGYSPPRVTEVAEATGLRPGWALDLTVNKDDGKPWDFNCPDKRRKAISLVRNNKAMLIC